MKLRGRIVGLVAIFAIAGTGIGAPVAFAATPTPSDFTGTYKLFYRYDDGAYSNGKLTLTEDHQGSDVWLDTVTWTAKGKTVTIKLVPPAGASSTPVTLTGVQTPSGIARKAKPGDILESNSHHGTFYAKLLPPKP